MRVPGPIDARISTEDRRAALGNFVAGARTALGLSQRELARRLRVSNSTLSRVESGEIAPRNRAELERYAVALELSPEQRVALLEFGGYLSSVASGLSASFDWSDRAFVSELLASASEAFHREGNLGRAAVFLRQILRHLPVSDERDLLRIRSRALLVLVWVRQAEGIGRVSEILPMLEEAEALSVRVGDKLTELDAIHAQGLTYGNRGMYPEALRRFLKALARSERAEHPTFRAMLYRDILNARTNSGHYEQPDSLLNEGLEFFDRTGDGYRAGLLVEASARVLSARGEHDEAQNRIARSLELITESGCAVQPLHHVIVSNTAAEIYLAAGDKSIGRLFAENVLALSEVHGYSHQRRKLEEALRKYLDDRTVRDLLCREDKRKDDDVW